MGCTNSSQTIDFLTLTFTEKISSRTLFESPLLNLLNYWLILIYFIFTGRRWRDSDILVLNRKQKYRILNQTQISKIPMKAMIYTHRIYQWRETSKGMIKITYFSNILFMKNDTQQYETCGFNLNQTISAPSTSFGVINYIAKSKWLCLHIFLSI